MSATVQDQFKVYTYPMTGYSQIHMIWSEVPCNVVCWNDGYKYIEAFRSPLIEFFLVQHPWLENDSLYADIILPVTTTFENDIDIISDTGGTFNTIYMMNQAIQPIGESVSDTEVCEKVAAALDSTGALLAKFTGGKTHADWAQVAFNNSGVQSMISWADFQTKGYYVVPCSPSWSSIPVGMSAYYKMATGAGLNTPDGKIEFFAQGLFANFPNDTERPLVPHYIANGKTHQESLSSPRAKTYPLLLISNHPRWRVHVEGDDISWLREIETCKIKGPDGYAYEPLWIHPVDAGARGIKQGDIVQMYNERGVVLGGAYITERIVPGAVYQDHGARIDLIADGIDRGGSNNLISPLGTTSQNCAGMATSGFLVQVAKADMASLMAQYPDAFKRTYDEAAGQTYDSWVSG
jgi:trimethylamine-N-oxide reductase (cytochrome c)